MVENVNIYNDCCQKHFHVKNSFTCFSLQYCETVSVCFLKFKMIETGLMDHFSKNIHLENYLKNESEISQHSL